MSQIIVNVTDSLASSLVAAQDSLINCKSGPLNDKDHFQQVVYVLNKLTSDTLNAMSAERILENTQPVARFDMGSGTDVYATLAECVTYLREDVPALRSGVLGSYQHDKVDVAVQHLRVLYRSIKRAMLRQAHADLDQVNTQHTGWMLITASQLARDASVNGGDAPDMFEGFMLPENH